MSKKNNNKNINPIPNMSNSTFSTQVPLTEKSIEELHMENIDENGNVVLPEELKKYEDELRAKIDPFTGLPPVEESKEEIKEESKPVEKVPTISTPTEIKQPEEKKEERPIPSIIGKSFSKGKLVKLNRIPVYDGPMTLYPKKYLTGNYFIYDGIERAGRYRITDERIKCGKGTQYIIGYIEKKEFK